VVKKKKNFTCCFTKAASKSVMPLHTLNRNGVQKSGADISKDNVTLFSEIFSKRVYCSLADSESSDTSNSQTCGAHMCLRVGTTAYSDAHKTHTPPFNVGPDEGTEFLSSYCNLGGPGKPYSVKRLTTDWTVRGSNPRIGEISRTRPGLPCGQPSLLYKGYRFFNPLAYTAGCETG
jgi:hypothetical protein